MGLTLPVVLHLFRSTYDVGTADGVVYSVKVLRAAACPG